MDLVINKEKGIFALPRPPNLGWQHHQSSHVMNWGTSRSNSTVTPTNAGHNRYRRANSLTPRTSGSRRRKRRLQQLMVACKASKRENWWERGDLQQTGGWCSPDTENLTSLINQPFLFQNGLTRVASKFSKEKALKFCGSSSSFFPSERYFRRTALQIQQSMDGLTRIETINESGGEACDEEKKGRSGVPPSRPSLLPPDLHHSQANLPPPLFLLSFYPSPPK